MKYRLYTILVALLMAAAPMWAQKHKTHQPDELPSQLSEDFDDNDKASGGDAASLDMRLSLDEASLSAFMAQPLAQDMMPILRSDLLTSSQMGVMVWDLTTDSCLFRYNDQWRMRPASTQKLVTAITALDLLGENHKFSTKLFYTGTVNAESRTLTGNLYCVGGMDPCFGTDDMQQFVNAVKALGVDSIRGNIFADLSFKDDKLLGEGWCWDDDNPTLSPLLFNHKAEFAVAFLTKLRAGGLYVDAGTGSQSTPSSARQICNVERRLTDVLQPMMKKSDNEAAEAVFYQVANRQGGRQASAKSARIAVERVMRKAGLNPSDYYVADGSGLSLYNYVTPAMHVSLLRYAHQHPSIYQALALSLPVAGIDGTLASRMKTGSARSNVRAKTGTVTGVSSLAGYCTASNGHKLCFAIINQGQSNNTNARNLQDRICQQLCK